MPELNQTAKGTDLGYTGHGSKYNKYIYTSCPDCKKLRWVRLSQAKQQRTRCCSCICRARTGEKNGNWRGNASRLIIAGYIVVKLLPGSPYFPMTASRRRILEHRLIMAQHLGRCLYSWEIVHHKNGVRDDNRLENLELLPSIVNIAQDRLCNTCQLRRENRVLRHEIQRLYKRINDKLL